MAKWSLTPTSARTSNIGANAHHEAFTVDVPVVFLEAAIHVTECRRSPFDEDSHVGWMNRFGAVIGAHTSVNRV